MENLVQYLLDNSKIEIEKRFLQRKFKRYRCAFFREINSHYFFFRAKQDGVAIDFRAGEFIKIFIYTDLGVFVFPSKVVEVRQKLLKIQKPLNFRRIQRRKITRAPIKTHAIIEFIKNSSFYRRSVTVNDIGGGGISINTNEDLRNVEKIKVKFETGNKTIYANAQVVEVRQYVKPKEAIYKVSIKFITLNENELEHIMKQCIKCQLKARKKHRGIYD